MKLSDAHGSSDIKEECLIHEVDDDAKVYTIQLWNNKTKQKIEELSLREDSLQKLWLIIGDICLKMSPDKYREVKEEMRKQFYG